MDNIKYITISNVNSNFFEAFGAYYYRLDTRVQLPNISLYELTSANLDEDIDDMLANIDDKKVQDFLEVIKYLKLKYG
jgi:hypothetical protein